MKTGSIYIIKNKINNKVYIGQTTMTVHERFMAHMKPSNTKKRGTYKLYNAINKYGKENFYVETVESNIPLEKLDNKEIEYIKKFDSYQNGYNSTPGGDGRIINLLNDEEKVLEDAKNGKQATVLADEYGVNAATIYRTLHKLGFYYPETDANSIINEIKKKELSRKDIAKKYGVDIKTIYRIAKKNNLPFFEKIENDDSFNSEKFISDYLTAKTKADIYVMYGITPNDLKRLKKKYKLPEIDNRISKHRIGEVKKMSSGDEAKIIAYRSATDIDVEFSDGAIISKTSYCLFAKGKLSKPKNYKDRIGEIKIMNCGMKAEIINYKKYNDIDIRFEDGTIVEHRQYVSFILGNIKNPKIKYEGKKRLRIGEIRIMNDGAQAKIIEYLNSTNITIQFEDGTKKRCSYKSFCNGKVTIKKETKSLVTNNKRKNEKSNIINSKINETKVMKCGMEAKIIAYRSATDIDVQFADGFCVRGVSYSVFKKGAIGNKNIIKNINRLGETKVMKCGMEAKIIAYRSATDIDVQFEDGTVVENKRYQDYKNGNIRNINRYINRIGLYKKMNCGKTAKIIAYRSATDIDVQFEDGTVVEHRQYTDFKNGEILYPKTKR